MAADKNPRRLRLARHKRVRRKVSGDAQRPRLTVFRSSQHIYAQVVDDVSGHTMASASSLEPEIRASSGKTSKSGVSELVGASVARRTLSLGKNKVVFDRGGYLFHGRVKVLAESARKGGLVF